MARVMESPESVGIDAWARICAIHNKALGVMSGEIAEMFGGMVGEGPYFRQGVLVRESDPSGISGTGDVAYVLQPLDGAVCLVWPKCRGIEAFANVDDALECHGHGGQTWILWADGTTSGKGGV